MNEIGLTINGKDVSVRKGTTIFEAAKSVGIEIPRLCLDARVEPIGSCRMCVVKVEGTSGLTISCCTAVSPGMRVCTEDEEIAATRKTILELILSEHCVSCTRCDREGACRLQDYAYRYMADESRFGAAGRKLVCTNYSSNSKGILYDPSRCILCGLCVKYCEEVQMAFALTFAWRQDRMEVSTAYGMDLHESTCEMCGGCVRVCPSGAMLDRAAVGKGREKDLSRTRTICPYCGVGCQMDLLVDVGKNRIVRATAEPGSPINDGNLCVKGHFGFEFVSSPDRLTDPLVRKNGSFEKTSWEEAMGLVGKRMQSIRLAHGPDAIAFLSSCRCSNEENYLMQKLARAGGGTNNVDQCATTCHAPTVEGLASAFGSGAMTNSVLEIRDCDVLLVIGSNPTEAHPIVGLEMKRALRVGATLIVCDPRKTWIAGRADIHIQHMPGSDNMLLNAIMHTIVKEGWADEEFIKERVEGFEAFRDNLEGYPAGRAAEYCGISADAIVEVARLYAHGRPSSIFYTLGITEHSCGTDNVKNLANLAMLCGQIGKWASGVNPLRGQNNVQGGCDMGAMAHKLPGYQNWKDETVRAKFEKAWNVTLPTNRGGRITDFIEMLGNGTLKGFYVMGEDPVLSEPNQSKVIEY
ncbi:MAG: molybdopterin-dependent oxidoreductase, partial [Planctomycetota bacterium]